jgi:Na+/H+ antiporter NhaA
MSFFFFLVVGLEARREFDIGEFRERPRIILPVLAGLGGMAGAVGLYLAINAGRTSAHGWGVAMSTDTAFALCLLAVLGRHAPERLRGFILTLTVVDDIVGLVVIATVYTHHLTVGPLIIAISLMALAVLAVSLRVHYRLLYFVLAAGSWVALVESGVDPRTSVRRASATAITPRMIASRSRRSSAEEPLRAGRACARCPP